MRGRLLLLVAAVATDDATSNCSVDERAVVVPYVEGETVNVPGSTHSGVALCCAGQTLYVNTLGWAGPRGVRLEQDAAGEWKGAIAAILREMTTHMAMQLVFLEQEDCSNSLATSGFGQRLSLYCTLISTNATVPIAAISTLWDNWHGGTELVQQGTYLTSSLMELDTTALLSVRDKVGTRSPQSKN